MEPFLFRQFSIRQTNAAMKVGTDAMVLGSLCDFTAKQHILDIGTGTGVLSLMIAQRFHPETITAVELDDAAFEDTCFNFAQSPFDTKLIPIQGNVLEQRFESKFDGIVSNPPFFENSTKNTDESKLRARHTDSLSFADLLSFAGTNLSNDGIFWLIAPSDQKAQLEILAAEQQLFLTHSISLYGKPGKLTRCILAFEKTEKPLKEQDLIIRNTDGSYTDAYIELTKDFHGKDLRKDVGF